MNISINSISKTTAKLLIPIFRDITKNAWADPGIGLVGKWIDLSNSIYVAEKDEKKIGFAMASKLEKNAILLTVTMVSPLFQNVGIASSLNNKIIKENLSWRNVFSPFYIVFRTTNPSLYEKIYPKVSIYPDYLCQEKTPSPKELELFLQVAKLYAKDKKIDKDKFVIYNANYEYPQLTYEENMIPWSKNSKINDFFDETLSLKKMGGNAIVIVGRLNLLTKLFLKVI